MAGENVEDRSGQHYGLIDCDFDLRLDPKKRGQ
jgi:hypothetical protein